MYKMTNTKIDHKVPMDKCGKHWQYCYGCNTIARTTTRNCFGVPNDVLSTTTLCEALHEYLEHPLVTETRDYMIVFTNLEDM